MKLAAISDIHGNLPALQAVLEDIARQGEGLDEDGWSDVGHGTIDWRGLMRRLREKSAARHYIMEQDNPNDIERFARRSIEAAQAF